MKLSPLFLLVLLAACATPRPTFTTGVAPVEAHDVIPTPCVDAKDIPEEYVTAIPKGGDVGQNAAGAEADLKWLVPRYRKARAALVQCSQEVKP